MIKRVASVAIVVAAAGLGAISMKYAMEPGASNASILDTVAGDWDLPRIGGSRLSLRSLRGKVVVLDFWYRGCGWCIQAMPQIKELASDYKDNGVVVVGMNVDADEKNALEVMKRLALNYDSVRATQPVLEAYGVDAFPTVVVIDQRGIVRQVDVGYREKMREDLGAVLDRLLKK
jgi:thiol-disulfide isomerase/thioredoxin